MWNNCLGINSLHQSCKHLVILFWADMHKCDLISSIFFHAVDLLLCGHSAPDNGSVSINIGNAEVVHFQGTIPHSFSSASVLLNAVTSIPVISAFGLCMSGRDYFDFYIIKFIFFSAADTEQTLYIQVIFLTQCFRRQIPHKNGCLWEALLDPSDTV